MPVVRTDGRAGGRLVYGHVITKFSRMGSLPHFVTHGAPLRASRARAPLLTRSNFFVTGQLLGKSVRYSNLVKMNVGTNT